MNDYVDMLGMDNNGDFGRYGKYDVPNAVKKLKMVSDYAVNNTKLTALTETGLDSIPNPTWWTETLLKVGKYKNMQLA